MDNSNSLKYKFIVVGYGYDYYNYVYRQLTELPNTSFTINWPSSRIIRRIFSDFFSYNLPFKKVWLRFFICFLKRKARNMNCDNKDNICFLLLAGGANNTLLSYNLCERIKDSFENSKVVFFINDLISKTKQPVFLMKEHADLVYSFDPQDCKKYCLINHVIPYSDFPFPKEVSPKYDIAFVGAAKDRLNEILLIYFYLVKNNVKCYFRIIGVPKEKQIQADGLFYSGIISYDENLKILNNCNCILDVIQGDSSGNTIRVGEAIILGKKLLTNNTNTPHNGVFDENNMRVFNKPEDIDIQFLLDRSSVSYDIKEKMYPIDLLHNIDSYIGNE